MNWPKILEGLVEKLIFALILFLCGWAGTIIWNASVHQKEIIRVEVEAAVEILSGRISELEASIQGLRDELITNSEAKLQSPWSVPNLDTAQQQILNDIQIRSLEKYPHKK